MLQFVKDSIRELKHVVWPTHAETKKYLTIVLVVLVLFGAYLFIASTVFSEILYGIKDIVSPETTQNIDIQDITSDNIQIETVSTDAEGVTIVESTPDVEETSSEDATQQGQ